ncbi:hypothetical protein BDA99DRAFT_534906 [Phascolomyces articulosus]|uniref:Uncharacterized protein n=1 Tax=Phascolomyces articulosus TaxID=60185 RepID=A0AAD5KHF8_9FUNG|nr:hypothetical protein BDA99DRAFT_534906 [Phascolomyces articulosus]
MVIFSFYVSHNRSLRQSLLCSEMYTVEKYTTVSIQIRKISKRKKWIAFPRLSRTFKMNEITFSCDSLLRSIFVIFHYPMFITYNVLLFRSCRSYVQVKYDDSNDYRRYCMETHNSNDINVIIYKRSIIKGETLKSCGQRVQHLIWQVDDTRSMIAKVNNIFAARVVMPLKNWYQAIKNSQWFGFKNPKIGFNETGSSAIGSIE